MMDIDSGELAQQEQQRPFVTTLFRVASYDQQPPLLSLDQTPDAQHMFASSIEAMPIEAQIETMLDALESGDNATALQLVSQNPRLAFERSAREDNLDMNRSLFHHAAKFGRLDVLKYMYEIQANDADRAFLLGPMNHALRSTAIIFGAYYGHLSVCKWLIEERGVDVNTTDDDGDTPILSAARQGHAQIVEYLLQQGGDIDAAENDGFQAIHLAAYRNHKDVCAVLISHGLSVNAVTEHGISPLCLASQEGHADLCIFLIENGARVDGPRVDSTTPLFVAAYREKLDVASVLVEAGTNTATKDHQGRAVTEFAIDNSNDDMALLLFALGANSGDMGFS